eukprot:349608-Chlamydomonas_euryale.AAC.13
MPHRPQRDSMTIHVSTEHTSPCCTWPAHQVIMLALQHSPHLKNCNDLYPRFMTCTAISSACLQPLAAYPKTMPAHLEQLHAAGTMEVYGNQHVDRNHVCE